MRTALVLLLILVNSACNLATEEASCQKTTGSFVKLFNSQDFRKIGTLFQSDALRNKQFKSLRDNLAYIYSVAGEIRSMHFTQKEGDKLIYKSIHENTAMDITFQVNQGCRLTSYLIKTHYPDSLPQLERNLTSLSLPFHGEWFIEWGGSTLDQNYHNAHRNMKGAFDFSKKDSSGKSYRNHGKSNEDFYAFDQEVTAPCQATVIKVIDGIEDNSIGRPSAIQTYGNALVLQTAQEEFLLLAHLKNQSIVVREGQMVNQGDLLARCGNSGYSMEPHLHFIVQNVADLFHPTGAKCYFDNVLVNGSLKQDYSPVQGEQITN